MGIPNQIQNQLKIDTINGNLFEQHYFDHKYFLRKELISYNAM